MITESIVHRPVIVAVGVILTALVGCSRAPQQVTPPAPNDGLADLREMLRRTAAANEPVPKSPADLRMIDAAYPAAGRFLGTGVIEYVWGCRLADSPEAAKRIVAFETAAATSGGFALFQDGTIRQVTAAEFAELEKATP